MFCGVYVWTLVEPPKDSQRLWPEATPALTSLYALDNGCDESSIIAPVSSLLHFGAGFLQLYIYQIDFNCIWLHQSFLQFWQVFLPLPLGSIPIAWSCSPPCPWFMPWLAVWNVIHSVCNFLNYAQSIQCKNWKVWVFSIVTPYWLYDFLQKQKSFRKIDHQIKMRIGVIVWRKIKAKGFFPDRIEMSVINIMDRGMLSCRSFPSVHWASTEKEKCHIVIFIQ